MSEVLAYLKTLVRETDKTESEVMALAFKAGLRQLWRERILGRYIKGEIPREEAVESVGVDWVDLAERQHEAMLDDLAWAMEK